MFEPFPKIKRIFKDSMIITEKIDGTNAQVYICGTAADQYSYEADQERKYSLASKDGYQMYAGSRNRWITTEDDNYGFAKWVKENSEELFKLGEGRHFGEWWGKGIQRGYGLTEKRFSLFNTHKWGGNNASLRPSCCHIVPVLGCWQMDTQKIKDVLEELKKTGSHASPGYMDVEGIVVFHAATGQLMKYTVDDNHKG